MGTINIEIVILVGATLTLTGLIIWVSTVFNGIVTLRENTEKAWSNIDVLLKQRHDELPQLMETVKGYIAHEKSTLISVVEARKTLNLSDPITKQVVADQNISKSIETLFAVAENYPTLKSNTNFLELQKRITRLENEISDRREFFNDSVNLYNIRINLFPEMLIAKTIGCKDKPMYQNNNNEKETPYLST